VITDSQSFLFTLVNPSGNRPIKITPKPDAAICCSSIHGPTFGGASTSSFDLLVYGGGGWTSQLDLGYGFSCPANVKTYFTGKLTSAVSELEVFKVNL